MRSLKDGSFRMASPLGSDKEGSALQSVDCNAEPYLFNSQFAGQHALTTLLSALLLLPPETDSRSESFSTSTSRFSSFELLTSFFFSSISNLLVLSVLRESSPPTPRLGWTDGKQTGPLLHNERRQA